MKITPEQLAEWKALADAATPGPWWSGECVPADGHALAWLGNMFVDCNGGQKNYAEPSCDAEFIAASREAIPALIADLEEVTARAEAAGNMSEYNATCRESLREDLAATRKQLAEARNRENGVLVPSLEELQSDFELSFSQCSGNQITEDWAKKIAAQLKPLEPEFAKFLSGDLFDIYATGDEQPSELAMHRADYQACKAAGWESPEELLSAYKTLEKQLAEAQALVSLYRESLVNGPENLSLARAEELDKMASDTSALDAAIAEAVEPYRKDAERYRWLTNDHDSPDTRKACHDISARIPVMSYSAASQAIDAAIAANGGTTR